jgi:hypothetical protein
VNIIVNKIVAILKVLTFRDTVGSNKDIDLIGTFKNRFEEYEEGETELTADSMIPETVKRGGRIVLQCDDDGNIIREFSSASEASEAIGVDAKCIWDTAHGKQKHAGGYCWVYKDEYKPKAKRIPITKIEAKVLNDDDIEAIRERNRKRLEEESKDSKYGDYWTAPKHWR